MADDGYLIGFEDSSGNFVEVGRFNNLSENTSDPVFIEHTGSGTRMELDGSGFDMNGNDITNAGSVSTDVVATTSRNYADKTSSRSFGNWYQAPSDRDIYITISINLPSNTTADQTFNLDVNNTQSTQEVQRARWGSGGNENDTMAVDAVVPAGHQYRLRQAIGSVGAINRWFELR